MSFSAKVSLPPPNISVLISDSLPNGSPGLCPQLSTISKSTFHVFSTSITRGAFCSTTFLPTRSRSGDRQAARNMAFWSASVKTYVACFALTSNDFMCMERKVTNVEIDPAKESIPRQIMVTTKVSSLRRSSTFPMRRSGRITTFALLAYKDDPEMGSRRYRERTDQRRGRMRRKSTRVEHWIQLSRTQSTQRFRTPRA